MKLSDALALAQAHHRARRLDLAEEIYRRILAVEPQQAEAQYNLATALLEQDKFDEAIAGYERLLERNPNNIQALNNLGNAWGRRGDPQQAIACYQRAVQLRPADPLAQLNLGMALQSTGRLEEAAACCRKAIESRPDFPPAHYALANVLREQGRADQALACYQQALALAPDFFDARYNLANLAKEQGRLDDAIDGYQQCLRLRPQSVWAHDNLLLSLHYRPGITMAQLAEAHAEYGRRHAKPHRVAWRAHENDRHPDRPLRLGFVSPDLGLHPVGRFLVGTLECLDPAQCQAVCYSDRAQPDALTARLQAAATGWRDSTRLDDSQLAEQIRADRIDILFDLAGHTAGNRLLVFARKPAPIQATWIGYPGTSGVAAIDYLLCDRHLLRPGEETCCVERVLRMPDGFVCFDPPADAPEVAPLPALKTGHVTFASFSNPAKLSEPVVALWSRILARLPSARMRLAYRGLDNPSACTRLLRLFAAAGVGAERLDVAGWSPYATYLAFYGRVDLVLDPFPFSGGVTTCEALWMGVPVVTCPGATVASRHAAGHLSAAGLAETIARDPDHYVDLALSLATDLEHLAHLRANLRPRVAHSPLCDAPRFAQNLQTLLRSLWHRWTTHTH